MQHATQMHASAKGTFAGGQPTTSKAIIDHKGMNGKASWTLQQQQQRTAESHADLVPVCVAARAHKTHHTAR
jgi:hypothetical protein